MSILKVNQIQHANGTNAMTIDSSGNLSIPNNATITGTTTFTGNTSHSGNVLTPNRPFFSAYPTAQQTAAGFVAFNTVRHNIGNHYNTSTYSFVAPETGVYYFEAHTLSNRTTASGDYGFDFYVNGGIFKRCYDGSEGTASVHAEARGTLLVKLNENDYVQIYHYASAKTVWVESNQYHCSFSGCLIG